MRHTIDEYEFDGHTIAVVLDVSYELSPYVPATYWEPSEGGQLEDLSVSLVSATKDGATLVGVVHDLIEGQIQKELADGGPLADRIEKAVYEDADAHDDGDMWDDGRDETF